MREAFKHINFMDKTLRLIAVCNEIIEGYHSQGYDLTLRQLYYQLVSKDLIPNKQTEYDKLGETISNARLCGLVDWDAIVDRTRSLRGIGHTGSPEDAVSTAEWSYRRDKWEDQAYRVEVWVEKDALAGVIGRACNKLDIDYFSCRGYTSQSEMYGAAKRFDRYRGGGQTPIVLHFGDHDPSGIDMTRDIRERLEMFLYQEEVEVDRLALNMDQVRKYKPPPNPAKITDSRSGGYIKMYGSSSWELDALEPSVLGDLIEKAVLQFRDETLWDAAVAREKSERETLLDISSNYQEVVEFTDHLKQIRGE